MREGVAAAVFAIGAPTGRPTIEQLLQGSETPPRAEFAQPRQLVLNLPAFPWLCKSHAVLNAKRP